MNKLWFIKIQNQYRNQDRNWVIIRCHKILKIIFTQILILMQYVIFNRIIYISDKWYVIHKLL